MVQSKFESGLINSNGKWIVPYGKYRNIRQYGNGFAIAERYNQTDDEKGWTRLDAVVDHLGNQKFIMPAKKFFLQSSRGGFYDGLAIADFVYTIEDSFTHKSLEIFYQSVVNINGEVLFSDTSIAEITPFAYNRAFARNRSTKKWKLINPFGHQKGDSTFEEIMFDNYRGNIDELFYDGYAYVKLAKGWYKINTNGVLLDSPIAFLDDFEHHMVRSGDFIFVDEDISDQNSEYYNAYGFWNAKKNVMVPPTYHDINTNVIGDNLIYANKNGHIYYLSQTGDVIWKQKKSRSKKNYLDIDFMNRGYYYASSAYKSELAGYGGWGQSDNQSKKIDEREIQIPCNLQLRIDQNKKAKWEGYKGMKVYVTNSSKDTIYFNAQDSRLYLKLQAKNKKGEWQDIEYLPSSWCGNSYHMVYLASGECWEFNAPIYHGEVKTKLRAQLYYKKTIDQEKEDLIYSNEIDGSINPGQFWNKRTYYPGGIMDPYND